MPRPFYGLSLQQKFLLITFLGIGLLTLSLGSLAALRSHHLLHAAVEKQGRILAQTVAALIINELIYEKLGLIEEGGLIDNYVREIYGRKDLDFLYVAVLDENNRVISHSDFSYYGTTMGSAIAHEAGMGEEVVVHRTRDQEARHEVLEFAAPLSIGGKRWGVFMFAVSLADIQLATRLLTAQIVAVLVLALLAGLGLIIMLNRKFILPITTLAQAMQEIDSELPDRKVEVRGSDELALLGHSFNNMIDRIRETNLAKKRAHEKLLQSEKLATLGILSYRVAHRINNPLGGLFNCLWMMERQGHDPSFRQKYIDLLREGLESIQETVEQLLRTAGKKGSHEREVPVADLLARIMRLLDYRMKDSAISYHSQVDPALVLPIPTHDLQEILHNSLVNAVQSMPNGGTLELTIQKREDLYLMEIKDSGVGIPVAEQEKIFDLFYTTKGDQGTGLGLWMTSELVKKYKGKIRIESAPGAGTTLIISIPEA
ncbi:sensor histidine kinase [Desulfurivibrio sp. D14AmB]|uniref:sensor histidine kinase n=1 Tax=Desulfurivibrio sp. D14AmB TaxID=3374370 RepID=UPI00376ED6F7